MANQHIDALRNPIDDAVFRRDCRSRLEKDGALVLAGFFNSAAIERILDESSECEGDAYYANATHNVYLTPPDPALPSDHAFNRQVTSSKGLIADDQIPEDSPLRSVYEDAAFRSFLCAVLDIDQIYPYADELSSINVHFAAEGRELGWHFDNSSFAVTMLLRAPISGGVFEYVAGVRNAAAGDMAFERVDAILDGAVPVKQLGFASGDLVLFRGRDAMHRVTPTQGGITRMLVVFAFHDQPGIALSASALSTFYGRSS
jgi:hypothetical protein